MKTGPFTWMTIGSVAFDPVANQPRLSDVHGVQSTPARNSWKRSSIRRPDQIRVAMNEPKTVAYVIQVKGFEPSQEDLEQQFLVEDFRKYARLALNDEQMQYVDGSAGSTDKPASPGSNPASPLAAARPTEPARIGPTPSGLSATPRPRRSV